MNKALKMKYLFISIFFLLIIACSSQKEISMSNNETNAEEDSVSYELIILDPGFDVWFLTHSKASWYYSQEYYEHWNSQYVNAWNYKSLGNRYSQLLNGIIDYDNFTDYGLEVNHKLFYYFQYVEHELNIPILDSSPRAARY